MLSHKMYIKRGRLGGRGLQIMISNELKALWSNRQIIYSSLLSPILYLLFYSVGIQSTFGNIVFSGVEVSFLSYSLIGIFTMSLFKEMYQCVYRMIIDKRWGLLSLKLLNGVNPPLYILGISTFPIIGVLVQATILYALSAIIGGVFPFYRFCMILLLLITGVLFWASVLICVALLVKNYKQRDFVMDTLMLPILFAAPLFYSFENAPLVLRAVSAVNPLSYQVQAMRMIAFGIPEIRDIAIVLVLAVIAYLSAIFFLSRTDFQNDEH